MWTLYTSRNRCRLTQVDIDDFVQDCKYSIATHWCYYSPALSYRYILLWMFLLNTVKWEINCLNTCVGKPLNWFGMSNRWAGLCHCVNQSNRHYQTKSKTTWPTTIDVSELQYRKRLNFWLQWQIKLKKTLVAHFVRDIKISDAIKFPGIFTPLICFKWNDFWWITPSETLFSGSMIMTKVRDIKISDAMKFPGIFTPLICFK